MASGIATLLGYRELAQSKPEEQFAERRDEMLTAETYSNGTARFLPFTRSESEKLLHDGVVGLKTIHKDRKASPERYAANGFFACILQRSRPSHVSGRSDALPFGSADETRSVFDTWCLPLSYLHLCDGSLTAVSSYVNRDRSGSPTAFEFIAHCVTKQGDWALAMNHASKSWITTAYLGVDNRVDADGLVQNIQDLQTAAAHPMLLPCIMFSVILHAALQRRQSLKARLKMLEHSIKAMDRQANELLGGSISFASYNRDKRSLDETFEILQGCRKDQESRKGRYTLWRTYKAALDEGFDYAAELLKSSPDDTRYAAHEDLKKWAAIIWQRLQSLKARDKDHLNRVDNASFLIYKLVQQRDIRLQTSIARAAQQDSTDMKFIAVLGSVFLPAGLVASILNVQEFQFVPGAQLFGAYVGITVPFIAIVVMICLRRPDWKSWRPLRSLSAGHRPLERWSAKENA